MRFDDLYFHVILGCGNDAQFQDFCRLINQPQLAEIDEYKTNEDRVRNRTELISVSIDFLKFATNYIYRNLGLARKCTSSLSLLFQIITSILKQKTNAEWDRIFGGEELGGEQLSGSRKKIRAKFPYGPVNNLSEVFQDSQVKYNQTEIDMEHENVGSIKQVLPNLTDSYFNFMNFLCVYRST